MTNTMASLHTNRDFYKAIAELTARERAESPPLVEYLRALLASLRALADRPALDPGTFAAILAEAFTARPHPPGAVVAAEGFAAVESVLNEQIDDLLAMKANGTLEDGQRYFGVDAPSGRRWYNFDPLTYVECGVQGAFGGYQGDEDTGRVTVPGKVAVVDEHGKIVAVDPVDLHEDVEPLDGITWENVEQFLWCGQAYE